MTDVLNSWSDKLLSSASLGFFPGGFILFFFLEHTFISSHFLWFSVFICMNLAKVLKPVLCRIISLHVASARWLWQEQKKAGAKTNADCGFSKVYWGKGNWSWRGIGDGVSTGKLHRLVSLWVYWGARVGLEAEPIVGLTFLLGCTGGLLPW